MFVMRSIVEQEPGLPNTTRITDAPPSAGVVSIGDHFTAGNIHLISNFWGLDTFMDLPLPDKQLKLAFISTGSKPYIEHDVPARFLDAERAWLEKKQAEGRITFFECCLTDCEDSDDVGNTLADVDVIFMGGGNTQYLLEKIQDSGARPIIKELVDSGVWYLGKSAGAVVAGPDIDPRGFLLETMQTRSLTDTSGLGLTDVYPMPHIDTPTIMSREYNGKTGWQIAVEMTRVARTAYILDNTDQNKQSAAAAP